MQTKLSTLAGRIVESGWLAALIVVPLLFNVYTERVFEEDKIPLLRSISLLMLAWLIVYIVERGRAAWMHDERPWYKWPLVIPALALSGAYIIATIFSVQPDISWWGAYIRRQGTYSWLSYIIIFFGIIFVVRDKRQVTRIINVMLLASVPAALYAFLQSQGLDPLPWGGDVQRRVSSVAGNPIFISAYLIMVMPLTLMRVIEHFRTLFREENNAEGDKPNYLASSLLAGAYLFLLILQGMTIVFSQSRGPLLGLLIGLTFFAILGSLPISRKLTLAFTGVAVAGVLFLIVFNLPNSPLSALRDVRYIGRLGSVFEVNEGNGLVRALIWKGAEQMIKDNPARSIIGFGPETMYMSYTPYYPPELAQVEKRNASPDRSHNETFDSIIMTGWIGLVAQFSVFIGVFYYALKWLGLIITSRQRMTFFSLLALGGIVGVALPPLVDGGSWRFAGVGLPFGIIAGATLYLLVYALLVKDDNQQTRNPQWMLLVALLSAIIAHFIEIHFGIAIGVTRLYFWVLAGLVVVVGYPMLQGETGEAAVVDTTTETRKRRPTGGGRRDARAEIGNMVGLSLMMALVLVVMTFNFITPSIDISAKGYSIVWLFAATFIFGALLVTAEAARESVGRLTWVTRLLSYVTIAGGTWLLFRAVFQIFITPANLGGNVTPAQLIGAGLQLANTISSVYVFTFIIIFATAFALTREEPQTRTTTRLSWSPILAGALSLAVIPLLVTTNLYISLSDVLSKQGGAYENQQQYDAAIAFYDSALNMQPSEDRYFLNLGRAYLSKARTATDTAGRDAALAQGQAVLERAQSENPLNMDHARNLASLHRVWAAMIGDSDVAQRDLHYDESDRYYLVAVGLSPNNAAVWNDYALLKSERGDKAGAEEIFAHSLEIDTQYINTYILRGNLFLDEEKWEESLQDYTKAAEIDPTSVPAISGQAFALAKLERTDEAIAANQKILSISPNDFTALKNLALLYRDNGQMAEALQNANAALAVAPADERAGIEGLIQEISAGGAGDSTPGGE